MPLNGTGHMTKMATMLIKFSVLAKTAGVSDKTAKFKKCPANFVSLPDSMSTKK